MQGEDGGFFERRPYQLLATVRVCVFVNGVGIDIA